MAPFGWLYLRPNGCGDGWGWLLHSNPLGLVIWIGPFIAYREAGKRLL